MGRIITQDKMDAMNAAIAADKNALGPTLGVMLIKGNVPVEAAATMLAVSEPTIYRWMYGESSPRDPDKVVKLKNFLMLLRRMRRDRELPLEGTTSARVAAFVKLVKKHHVARAQTPV